MARVVRVLWTSGNVCMRGVHALMFAIRTLPDGVNPSRDLTRDGTRTGPEEFLVFV